MPADHSQATDVHRLHYTVVADAAALAALTPGASDIGRVAIQTDINRKFMLIDNTGPVWFILPETGVVVLGNSTGSVDLDLADGETFTIFDQTGNITFTISNPVQTGYKAVITLYISMDGTGGYTRTWPASVLWPGGAEPALSDGVDEIDLYTLISFDGGTTWNAFLPGAAMA